MSAPQSNVLTRREVASWRNAIFVTFGLSGFALSNWLSRVPAVRDQLQVDTAILGLVILGLAVGSILGLVVSSGMVARWGTARSVAFGLIVGAFGLPVAALGTQLNVPLAVFAGLAVFGF